MSNGKIRVFSWPGRPQMVVLLGVTIVVAGALGFLLLADVISHGTSRDFDEWGLRAMRRIEDPAMPIGPEWLIDTAHDFTALGDVVILTLITLAMTGYFLLNRNFTALAFVLTAVLGGLTFNLALKSCYERPRPQVVPHLCSVDTSSFPSGHSMMSATVYLTLGAVLTQTINRRRLKIFFGLILFLTVGLVGTSRVFLGVHYPTDVLAGWTAGLVWGTLWWLLARKLLNYRPEIRITDPPPARA